MICEVCKKRRVKVTCLICDRPICERCAYGEPGSFYLKKLGSTGPSFGVIGLNWRDRLCSQDCVEAFKRERRQDPEVVAREGVSFEDAVEMIVEEKLD